MTTIILSGGQLPPGYTAEVRAQRELTAEEVARVEAAIASAIAEVEAEEEANEPTTAPDPVAELNHRRVEAWRAYHDCKNPNEVEKLFREASALETEYADAACGVRRLTA